MSLILLYQLYSFHFCVGFIFRLASRCSLIWRFPMLEVFQQYSRLGENTFVQCWHDTVVQYSYNTVVQYSYNTVVQYSYNTVVQYSYNTIVQYSYNTVVQYSYNTIVQYSYNTVVQYSHNSIVQYSLNTIVQYWHNTVVQYWHNTNWLTLCFYREKPTASTSSIWTRSSRRLAQCKGQSTLTLITVTSFLLFLLLNRCVVTPVVL